MSRLRCTELSFFQLFKVLSAVIVVMAVVAVVVVVVGALEVSESVVRTPNVEVWAAVCLYSV